MWKDFPFIPDRASSVAGGVDALFFFQTAVTVVMSLLIFAAILLLAVRFRRKSQDERPKPVHGSTVLEITWSVIPFLVMMAMFVWGTDLFFRNFSPSEEAMDIYVTGKQWMWKVQHPDGRREINELHVPVGKTVRLTMSSEDVIHSFFIPAFRVKRDVLPGSFSNLWFKATKPGKFHLFCAEYCGNQHSGMIGWVYVMEPLDYENWLSGGSARESMAQSGEKLFERFGCASCHRDDGGGRGPSLVGIFKKPVQLTTGAKVLVDEAYLRESILNPALKIVAGYQNVMPTFQGQISEEDLLQLIAYIKSKTPKDAPAPAAATAPAAQGKNTQ